MKRTNYSNSSVKEQKALQEPKHRDDIVIADADKGGAVVILDAEDYIKEAEWQAHKTENCKRLNYNPTTNNNETLNKITKRFLKENLISKNIAKGLKKEKKSRALNHHIFIRKYIKKVLLEDLLEVQ